MGLFAYVHTYMDIGGAAKGNAFGIMASVFIYIIIGNHGDLSIKKIDYIWLMRWRLILIENAGVSVTNDVNCQNYNRYYSPSYLHI